MKMSSRDDETLHISGYSEYCSIDVTADEDFIPTSQPQSILSSKVAKSALPPYSFGSSQEETTQPFSGLVDDTLPPSALIQETQDKSADFIPDTETKKRKLYYSSLVSCKKKLGVFEQENTSGSQQGNNIEAENSTLELPTNSSFCDSLVKMDSTNVKCGDCSITEILVNDSGETIELGNTPVKVAEMGVKVGKSESFESFGSGRCEETQIFDNSVLLLDQSGPSYEKKVKPQNLSLNEITSDNLELDSKSNLNVSVGSRQIMDVQKQNGNGFLKEEPLINTTTQDADSDSSSVIIKRNVDVKLTVSCVVTINATTRKVIKKAILNVNEKPKPKTPLIYNEPHTDFASDKSKRCSTSSSESVYSDKNGLPFPLPKRVSAIYDQICASDSSDENLAKFIDEKRNRERVPWGNEHLLALRMDEIIKGMIDNQDLINRPFIRSPRKSKRRMSQNDLNLLELISENSSSSQALKSETDESQTGKVIGGNYDEAKGNTFTPPPEESKPQTKTPEKNSRNDMASDLERRNCQERHINPELEKSQEAENIKFCDGLKVFARWTDKRYYSGVLSGQSKNEKWDVLFDDGTLKAIKEDFIIPVAWLKVGALVFALVDDVYESGQVIDVKEGESLTYVVQLDNAKRKLTVELPDMRLSDDLASIVRENYRPLGVESPQRKAEVTCDNVLSGKRLREYKTPLKLLRTTRIESSGSRKKPKSRTKDLEAITGTPRKRKSDGKVGLKTENWHLVEDNVPSAESPSGDETGETPFRSTAKEARGKAKPRSLTYGPEERQKKNQGNWLTADGIPIPGPSGVKLRKKKHEKPVLLDSNFEKTESGGPQQGEKNKRKRKAAESGKQESLKKCISETEIRMTRNRKK